MIQSWKAPPSPLKGYGSPRPPCGWGWVLLPPVGGGYASLRGAGPPASAWTQPIWGGGHAAGGRDYIYIYIFILECIR